jgi:hypothetical protein
MYFGKMQDKRVIALEKERLLKDKILLVSFCLIFFICAKMKSKIAARGLSYKMRLIR